MSGISVLAKDITYVGYERTRNKIIDMLRDDDAELDVQHIFILASILKNNRATLKQIKEYNNGKNRDINTEVRESN